MFTPPPEKKDAATIKREQKKSRQVKPDPAHAASSLLAWWACYWASRWDDLHIDVGAFPSCPHQDERGGHSPLSFFLTLDLLPKIVGSHVLLRSLFEIHLL